MNCNKLNEDIRSGNTDRNTLKVHQILHPNLYKIKELPPTWDIQNGIEYFPDVPMHLLF